MNSLVILIPIALLLALTGLGAFLWSLRNGQYEDLQGAAYRILEDDDRPLADDAPGGTDKKTSKPSS